MTIAIAVAPYIGVLIGLVCAGVYLYLWRTLTPVAVTSWRGAMVGRGDCPVEHCGGKTCMVACESYQTIWRCEHCRTMYMLSSFKGE